MTKNIFEKIFSGGVLQADDMTAAQKVSLYEIMEKYGASRSFTYDRFFKEGFRDWELAGVDSIKNDFASEHELTISETGERGAFYKALGQQRGLKATLREWMEQLGMKSEVTIIRRFSFDDWKPFETVGVKAIIEEYCRAQEEAA